MSLKHMLQTDVASVPPTLSVAEAARLMDLKNVGSLMVMDEGELVGILTDRDIVIRVVNLGRNAAVMTVREAMTPNPETLDAEMGLLEALERVRSRPIRRFPVVDRGGRVVGVFTLDDVVRMLGRELSLVAEILEREKALV